MSTSRMIASLTLVGALTTSAYAQYTTSIFAGGGPPNGSAATSIAISDVYATAVDSSGNVYVPAFIENRVYKVAPNGTVTTVAGNGTRGYSGDSGAAVNAQLNQPIGVAVDASGNLYISEWGDARVRKVSGGVITTFAGNGTYGYSGDGGAATSAELSDPAGLALDSAGNLYIADTYNYRIRKVSGGVITTVAGNGTQGYSGDNGAATSAEISLCYGVAVDGAGANLYIADYSNARVRRVSSGIITTFAGNGSFGFSGDGGSATSAELDEALGVAVDGSGNVYIGDGGNERIRKVSSGVITTVAGNGTFGFSGDGGPATSAMLADPWGVAVDSSGNFYFGDFDNYRIRKVVAGVINTIAGDGSYEYSGDSGLATNAQINPVGIAADTLGNLYIADLDDYRIRKVTGGTISTVAGNGTFGYSGDAGPATSAEIDYAQGLAVDSAGNYYIGDSNRVREVAGGVINTVAGNGTYGYSGDGGPATSAEITNPQSLAATTPGNIYLADQPNSRIRKVSGGVISLFAGAGPPNGSAATGTSLGYGEVGTAADSTGNVYYASPTLNLVYKIATNGTISTVAGNGTSGYSGDSGPATSAQLNNPQGVAIDGFGNLYIADNGNERIRRVSGGVINTVAGTGTAGYSGDNGTATSAEINNPQSLATDSSGNLYIADAGNNRIRKVSGGVITTVAGNGTAGFGGDGGMATSAALNFPQGVAVDSTGNIYIADNSNFRIRKVSGGIITTVAGSGVNAFGGDGGAATSAYISESSSVAVDGTGNNLYISDFGNDRVRKVFGGIITTFAGNGIYAFSGDSGPATSAELNNPTAVAVDGSGNVYIGDRNNFRIRKVVGGIISTIAGNGYPAFSGDGGSALNAQLNSPQGLAADSLGNLYVADSSNSRVRAVNSSGIISTFAGGGTQNPGDGGPATSAQLSSPGPVAVDSSNNVYFVDGIHVRMVSGGIINTIATLSNGGAEGIAVDSNGRVYVSDSNDGRVLVLSSSTLAPTISNISPDNENAGGPSFTLTVTGSGFVSGAVVQWNGSALMPTTFNSSSSLSATVPSSLIATSGTAFITVNEGGSTSNTADFTIVSVVTCSYTLTPSAMSVPITGGAETTVLTTNSGCGYTVQSNNSWIHITSGGSGTGSGTIGYSVDSNFGSPQNGSFTVFDAGGLAVVSFTVNQQGLTTLTVYPTTFTFSNQPGSGTVTLNPAGSWTAISNSPWVTVPASGSGSAITFNVANNTGATRNATITVNGTVSITVTQTGVVCTYSMAPSSSTFGSSQSFTSSAGGGGINVTSTTGCPWTYASTGTLFTSSVSGGSNQSASIGYGVTQNTTGATRTGTINITDTASSSVVLSFVVNQAASQQGSSCTAASTPAQLRMEGLTELLADLVLTCSTPVAGLTGDVVVSLLDSQANPVSISNRLLSTGGTDALLLLNGPVSSALTLNGNVFQGLLGGANYLVFPSVPLPAGNSFTLRITNVRVNANNLNAQTNDQVIANVNFVSSTPFTGTSNTPVGTALPSSNFATLATTSGPLSGQTIQPVQFTAQIQNAYRPRLAAGQDPSGAGTIYNTESGYVNTTVLGSQTGFATTGTRFLVSIANVPFGVSLYAPLSPVFGSNAQLIMFADNTGSGGTAAVGGTPFGGVTYQQVPVTAGVGTATWEVTASNAAFTFNLLISNPSSVSLSGMTITGSLAAQTGGGGVSAVAPIPRFAGGAVPTHAVSLNLGLQAGVPVQAAQLLKLLPAPRLPSGLLAPTVTFAQTVTNAPCQPSSNDPSCNLITGNTTANNGVLGGTLPPNWMIDDCTADNGAVCQITGTGNGFGVPYQTLGPGQSATVTVQAHSTVPLSGGGPEYNASVWSDLVGAAGSSFSGYLQMQNPPQLALVITDNGPFQQGETANYMLTISNLTTNPLNLSGLQVQDEIPIGLTFISMAGPGPTGSGWQACPASSSCLQYTSSTFLAPGMSLPVITVMAAVTVNAPSLVTNQVRVIVNNSLALIGDDKTTVQQQVSVPNVVGLTQTAAATAITGAGLVVGTVTTASSSTVPSGSVISESPAAGTPVAAGSAVNLVVSIGPQQVSVPNVVGFTQAAATTAITGAGLVLGTVTTASSGTVPLGSVISESPVAGTPVAIGSAVNLVVSSGPPACTYQLGSSAVTVSAAAGNYNVTVTAPAGCLWTAVSTANWVGITSGSGNGNGTLRYTVAENNGGYRSTELGIAAGQGFLVNQLAQRVTNITDFDGDGKADLAIYRPSNGLWSIQPSSTGGSSIVALWGIPGDISVVGDFDGDKVLDFAVYRPSTGAWYIIPSSTGVPYSVNWGLPGDVPIPADYDGDGRTDLAVWRPSNQTWYVIPSSNPGLAIVKTWGIAGDQPVQGDFDGDGKKDFAVYRPSTGAWYIIPSSTGVAYGVAWGIPGDEPVPADFDGDGKTDLAVYRSSTGTWYVIPSSTGVPVSRNWGLPGDQPVLLDYDGDHKADFSVYRPSNQTWYVIQSSTGTVAQREYGLPNDIPLYRPWPWQ